MRLGLESASPREASQASARRRSLTTASSAFSPIDVDGDSTDDAETSTRNYHDLSALSSPSTRPSLLDLSSDSKTSQRHQQARDLHYESSDDSEKKSEPRNSVDNTPEEKQNPLNFFFNMEQRNTPEQCRDSNVTQRNNNTQSSPMDDDPHEVISAARAIICGQKFDHCELKFGDERVKLTIWKGGKRRWQGKIKYAHMVRFCYSRVDHSPYILLLQLDSSKGRSDFATFYDPIFAEVCEKNEMKATPKVYGVVFYFDDQVDYMRCQSMGDNNPTLAHLFKEKLSEREVREYARLDASTKSRYQLRSEPKGGVSSSSTGRSLTKTVMNGAKHAIGSVTAFFIPIPRSSVLEADENPSVVSDREASFRGRTLNLSRDNTEVSSIDSGEEKAPISVDDTIINDKNDHGLGTSAHNGIETVVLIQNTQRESSDNAFEVDPSPSSVLQKEEKNNASVESRKRALFSRREDEKLKRRKIEDRRNEVLLNYPYDGSDNSGRISVTLGDVDRLVPGEFLNDNIIDFYLRYLWRHLGSLDQQRMYFYTSHFFTQLNGTNGAHELTTTDPDERFARVARWTQKETNLFDKQFLFIPINDSFHWSIAVFCNPGSAIIKKHRHVRHRRHDVCKRDVVNLVDDGGSGVGADNGDLKAMGSSDDSVKVEVEENEVLSCQEDRLANPPCLLFLDSLRCHRKKKFTKMLRDYLECEWKSRYSSSAVVSLPKDSAAVANGIDQEDSIVTIFDSESIALLEPNVSH
ncbi:Hypothetical protein PHPALM_15814 [Phytophthora palmivora]|uniref:Ubiquitin-like protease family profile domain-containing protein n=1 Tax=Phytophthora palmivora TaxID=4796 RepID=A0A2P4XR92_9STRA|nr:Hypothetical protein PHPALM_15814 [Phytophthora palmivora]